MPIAVALTLAWRNGMTNVWDGVAVVVCNQQRTWSVAEPMMCHRRAVDDHLRQRVIARAGVFIDLQRHL